MSKFQGVLGFAKMLGKTFQTYSSKMVIYHGTIRKTSPKIFPRKNTNNPQHHVIRNTTVLFSTWRRRARASSIEHTLTETNITFGGKMQFPIGMAYFSGYVGFRLREGEVLLSLSSSTSACSVFVWIWFLLDAWKPATKKGEKNNLNTGKPVNHEGHYGSLQIKRLFTHWVHQDWTATTNPYHSFLVGVWTNPCEKY